MVCSDRKSFLIAVKDIAIYNSAEENLRKPEYFGQYGKISKIVINRNHNPGDPRRASASAYVTFAHKVSVYFMYIYIYLTVLLIVWD